MFKSLIYLLITNIFFPAITIAFGFLWLHFFPQYWGRLMLLTIIVLIWLAPRLTEKFTKYD